MFSERLGHAWEVAGRGSPMGMGTYEGYRYPYMSYWCGGAALRHVGQQRQHRH